MFKNLNIQYVLSYLGIIPYAFIIIDKYFFFKINEITKIYFIIDYTLIIIVFIGAINWDFSKKVSFIITLYGFLPSLFALVILILKINYFIFNYIFYFLILFLVFQIIVEYFLIYSNIDDKTTFNKVRVPLTTIIIFSLIII